MARRKKGREKSIAPNEGSRKSRASAPVRHPENPLSATASSVEPAQPALSRRRPAVLLVNQGSPETTALRDVRRYLIQFLGDIHVVESPLLRFLLRYFLIPFYAERSAEKYRGVEMPEGLPLPVHSRRLVDALIHEFDRQNIDADLFLAMRHGSPNLVETVGRLVDEDRSILLVPLFPQHHRSTSASAIAAAVNAIPDGCLHRLDIIGEFWQDEGYLDAMTQKIAAHWAREGRGEKLVYSFHAVPMKPEVDSKSYLAACARTAEALSERLGLARDDRAIAYQSRFGHGHWSKPELTGLLEQWARSGVGSVDIVCPGFVADNLETFHDIDRLAKQVFLDAGGRRFSRIDCLNDEPVWAEALAKLIGRRLMKPDRS